MKNLEFIITWGLMGFETTIFASSPEVALQKFYKDNSFATNILVSEVADNGKSLIHYPSLTI